MIKKIALSLMLVCLFIAIPLAIFGIKRVDLGPAFLSFMEKVDSDLSVWKVEIPNIPRLELLQKENGWTIVLNFLIRIYNIFVVIANGGITIINIFIQTLQFICTLLWDIAVVITTGKNIGSSDYEWAWSTSLPVL